MGAATEPPGVCAGLGGAGKGLLEAGGGSLGTPCPPHRGSSDRARCRSPAQRPPLPPRRGSPVPRPRRSSLPDGPRQICQQFAATLVIAFLESAAMDAQIGREEGGEREGASLLPAAPRPSLPSPTRVPPTPGDGGSLGTPLVSSALILTPPAPLGSPGVLPRPRKYARLCGGAEKQDKV